MPSSNINENQAVESNKTPAEAKLEPQVCENNEAFSIFNHRQKIWIATVASASAVFSTISSYIYYPAIVPMAEELDVSVALINLTVTSYLIVAGVAPAFLGDIADQSGRRPAYMVMFALMIASNVGLAAQRSYSALFVLRMVQSAGSSGTYAAAYGVISDIATHGDRGSYVGFLIACGNAAPSFGPVIGGILAQTLGWRSIFWFLAIATAAVFIFLLLFFPETQRKVVGNGNTRAIGVYKSLFPIFWTPEQRRQLQDPSGPKRKHHFPNPLSCIPLLFRKGNFLVIALGSLTYSVKMTLMASLSTQCIEIYGLNYLEGGLVYLSSGAGGFLAAYSTGKFLDWNYRQMAKKMGRSVSLSRGDDISDFPIESARLRGIYILATGSAIGTLGYGISIDYHAHLSVPLIIQFFTGFTTSSIFAICGTLLSDLNPDKSATVQASYSIVRCLMAGAGIGILEPLLDGAGLSWTFAVYAFMMILTAPIAWVVIRYGLVWRQRVASGSAR